jgi:peptide chain release factor 1
VALFIGKGAYSRFKYESGTNGFTCSETEAQAQNHTSAVFGCRFCRKARKCRVHFDPRVIKIDVYRSTVGTAAVNTSFSGSHYHFLGAVVTCQDEKIQIKNKNKAMKVLRARLLDQMIREQDEKRSEERKTQI